MHNVTRVRCTMRTMSNASALAHQDKLDDVVLDSCSDFRILYNMRKEYTIYVRIFWENVNEKVIYFVILSSFFFFL